MQGVDSGEMEVQRQREGEEEEMWKDRQNQREEEERAERSTESTIHTVPGLLLDTMQVLSLSLLTWSWVSGLIFCFANSVRESLNCMELSKSDLKSCVCVFAESRERPGGDQEKDGTAAGGLAQTVSRLSGGGESDPDF